MNSFQIMKFSKEIIFNSKKQTQLDPKKIHDMISEGMKLFYFNKFDKSMNVFESISKLLSEPKNDNEYIMLGNVYNMIARILYNKKETENALKYYDKSLRLIRKYFPQEPEYQHKLAEMYINIATIKLNHLINNDMEDDIINEDTESINNFVPNIKTNKNHLNKKSIKNSSTNSTLVIKSEEVSDLLNRSLEIIKFISEKNPQNAKKYCPLLKEIYRNYGYYYLNEGEFMKSVEATKNLFETHIKAYGSKNKETIDIGLEISNKLVQFKKFQECMEFTENILIIKKEYNNDLDDEINYIHYNLYVCAINYQKLDYALNNILECLKIREKQLSIFDEEVDKKLNFIDLMDGQNMVSEVDIINKIENKSNEDILSHLEKLLKTKTKEDESNPFFKDILEKIVDLKNQREAKRTQIEKIKNAKELQLDNEDNEIELIRKNHNPKEKLLSIHEQKLFEIGLINERICEIYLKKKEFKKAFYYCYDSLKNYEKLEVSRLHRTYSNLSMIYHNLKNHIKCIEFSKKALFSPCHEMEDLKINNGELYFLIATSYGLMKNYEKALKYQEKAVKFCEIIHGNGVSKYGLLIEKLAFYQKELGNLKDAESNYEMAFANYISQSINPNIRRKVCHIAFEIGSLKFQKKDYINALKYYDRIMIQVFNHKLTLPNYMLKTINQRKKILFEEAKKHPLEMKGVFSEIEEKIEKMKKKDLK